VQFCQERTDRSSLVRILGPDINKIGEGLTSYSRQYEGYAVSDYEMCGLSCEPPTLVTNARDLRWGKLISCEVGCVF
jgi:hypothetical protein